MLIRRMMELRAGTPSVEVFELLDRRVVARIVAISAVVFSFCATLVHGLTPDSPEVRDLIDKGMAFLDRSAPGGRVGEKALIALAYYKVHGADHARVQAILDDFTKNEVKLREVQNYDLGLGIIFLSEIGNKQYLPLLQQWVDHLVSRQKPHGGWGYDGFGNVAVRETGDVSQTQYAVLALWMARNAGAKVPADTMERVMDWLLRVQDLRGGWGYQGVDSGSRKRVTQGEGPEPVTNCLTAAGLGAVLVCADFFGETAANAPNSAKITKWPTTLKPVVEGDAKAAPKLSLPKDWVAQGIRDGNTYLTKEFHAEANVWQYYYLYSLERYFAFRELHERKFEVEPVWYDVGVRLLAKLQSPEGNWSGDHNTPVSTAFAILFLRRSAAQSIKKKKVDLGDGILTSGKGLPTNLANASVQRGKLVDTPLAADIDDVTTMLEDADNPELLRLAEQGSKLTLDADLTKRQGQITKLKAMVSAKNWEARIVAVRALGQDRNLDHVPILLYALTDPDYRVVKEADTALRFLSRKFEGVGLSDEYNVKTVAAARTAWRNWYLSLRPNALLFD